MVAKFHACFRLQSPEHKQTLREHTEACSQGQGSGSQSPRPARAHHSARTLISKIWSSSLSCSTSRTALLIAACISFAPFAVLADTPALLPPPETPMAPGALLFPLWLVLPRSAAAVVLPSEAASPGATLFPPLLSSVPAPLAADAVDSVACSADPKADDDEDCRVRPPRRGVPMDCVDPGWCC